MVKKNGKRRKAKSEPLHVGEEGKIFIVLVLRPAESKEIPDAPVGSSVLTGWCVIAAPGLVSAIRQVKKIDLGVTLKDAKWTEVAGGREARLDNGFLMQVLPAPLYYVDEESPEPLVTPAPYVM